MGIKRIFPFFFPKRKSFPSPTGLKCALVEFNYYHGETLPTLVRILNNFGISVDVFCPRRLRHNNPFVYANDLHYRARDSAHLSSGQLAEHFRGFDFAIINSLEPKQILTTVENLSLPLIGIMHNGGLMIQDQDYANFFDSPKRKALVLGQHISEFVSKGIHAQWIAPVELGEVSRKPSGKNGRVIFCVQGNVEYERRNYNGLLEAVEHLNSRSIKNFKVLIIGRNDWAGGKALKNDIAARGLQHFFEFSRGELKYRDYYGAIANSDFLMPLVDRGSAEHAAYFENKLSTSMQIALAFQVVPIAHADLAQLYGVENESFTYTNNLAEAMLTALRAGADELCRMRRGLLQQRAALLEKSAANLKIQLRELKII